MMRVDEAHRAEGLALNVGFLDRPTSYRFRYPLRPIPEHPAGRNQPRDRYDKRDGVRDDPSDGDPLAAVLCRLSVCFHERHDAHHRPHDAT